DRSEKNESTPPPKSTAVRSRRGSGESAVSHSTATSLSFGYHSFQMVRSFFAFFSKSASIGRSMRNASPSVAATGRNAASHGLPESVRSPARAASTSNQHDSDWPDR